MTKSMFSEFTFRGRGSAQKDQQFTFFLDIELWTQSLSQRPLNGLKPTKKKARDKCAEWANTHTVFVLISALCAYREL